MHFWLIIALVIDLILVITSATALQVDIDDGKAWIMMICTCADIAIVGGLVIYYLLWVYPVLHGR